MIPTNKDKDQKPRLAREGDTLSINMFSNQRLVTGINLERMRQNHPIPITHWKVVDGREIHFLGDTHSLLATQYTKGTNSGYVEIYTNDGSQSLSLVSVATLSAIENGESMISSRTPFIGIYQHNDIV